jgi:hypothetical protein
MTAKSKDAFADHPKSVSTGDLKLALKSAATARVVQLYGQLEALSLALPLVKVRPAIGFAEHWRQ